jgi:hypothetical protein
VTRWKLHRRCWVHGENLAVVTLDQVEALQIPVVSLDLAESSDDDDIFLVDRRRLQRDVRREAESIGRDIDRLGALLGPPDYTSQRTSEPDHG